MLELKLFDLFDRDGTLAVNPLAIDVVIVTHVYHFGDAPDVAVGHEPETSGLLRPLVFDDDTVLQVAELKEVLTELVKL